MRDKLLLRPKYGGDVATGCVLCVADLTYKPAKGDAACTACPDYTDDCGSGSNGGKSKDVCSAGAIHMES